MTLGGGTRAPATLPAGDWDAAGDELVELVRQLIRIPSMVPVTDRGDGETRVARHIASALADVGVPSEVLEPWPGSPWTVMR